MIDGSPYNGWLLKIKKTIGVGSGCDLSVIARARSAWGMLRGMIAILTV